LRDLVLQKETGGTLPAQSSLMTPENHDGFFPNPFMATSTENRIIQQ
jgi:hypothetical protein